MPGPTDESEALVALRPTDRIDAFFGPEGPLAARLDGYKPRGPQMEMSSHIADVLEDPRGRLVVEAGTGTGKSMAYLAAALLSDKTVVVSTGTKALQDQLYDKDLPMALAALRQSGGPTKTAVLMKGRSNYLCLHKLEAEGQQLSLVDDRQRRKVERIEVWAGRTETGDRAELSGLAENDPLWHRLDASGERCLGQKCPAYDACFVTKMRRRAESADVIVVNHALLCANETLRLSTADEEDGRAFAQVIPEPDALIIDEAHGLEHVATQHFGVSVSSGQVDRLVRDLRVELGALSKSSVGRVRHVVDGLEAEFIAILDALAAEQDDGEQTRRLGAERFSPELQALHEALRASLSTLHREYYGGREEVDDPDDEWTKMQNASLEGLCRRITQVDNDLAFIMGDASDDAGFVVWIEERGRFRSLAAAPIDVAEVLARSLWSAKMPVVLTSATLSVAGTVDGFVRRVGMGTPVARGQKPDREGARAVETNVLPAPFNHKAQGALYVPRGMPEPTGVGYREMFDDEVKRLVNMAGGGALLLFTSHRALSSAHERLTPFFKQKGLQVLRQGEAPKRKLIADFVAADLSTGGILMATQSFWEGVDIKGRALRLVVIDKLPFRSPSDPIQQARAEWLKRKGRSPFAEQALPEAALTLKQGVGRLLRTMDDAGVVAVLDGRIRSKGYGKVFWQTLPPLTRLDLFHRLKAFWRVRVAPVLKLDVPESTLLENGSAEGSATEDRAAEDRATEHGATNADA